MFWFITSHLFERLVHACLDNENYGAMQSWPAQSPEAGDLVRRSGACRKLRWQIAGKGEHGCVRIIHYVKLRDARTRLLTIYGKGPVASTAGVSACANRALNAGEHANKPHNWFAGSSTISG